MTTEERQAPQNAPLRVWCPQCDEILTGEEIVTPPRGAARCGRCGADVIDVTDEEGATVRAPWHFKLLLAGTVGYLIYRLIWFIQWLQHH